MEYIDKAKFDKIVGFLPKCPYRDYLKMISKEPIKTWEVAR